MAEDGVAAIRLSFDTCGDVAERIEDGVNALGFEVAVKGYDQDGPG